MSPATATAAAPRPSSLRLSVALLRPRQWLKNGFVLAPLLFSGELGRPAAVRSALLATAAFCLISSAGYILNDLRDREIDRAHPRKRDRPLASGRMGRGGALALALASLAAAGAFASLLPGTFAALLAAYFLWSGIYTLWLKHVAIADVLAIAIGFVLRVLGGSAALRVPASHWMLLCTFLLAAYLGTVKRKAELSALRDEPGQHRRSLVDYSPAVLDQAAPVLVSTAILSYALYTVAPETVARFGSDQLIYTLPLVVYGMLRFMQLAHADLQQAGEASLALLSDRPLQICVSLWIAAVAAILYLR